MKRYEKNWELWAKIDLPTNLNLLSLVKVLPDSSAMETWLLQGLRVTNTEPRCDPGKNWKQVGLHSCSQEASRPAYVLICFWIHVPYLYLNGQKGVLCKVLELLSIQVNTKRVGSRLRSVFCVSGPHTHFWSPITTDLLGATGTWFLSSWHYCSQKKWVGTSQDKNLALHASEKGQATQDATKLELIVSVH